MRTFNFFFLLILKVDTHLFGSNFVTFCQVLSLRVLAIKKGMVHIQNISLLTAYLSHVKLVHSNFCIF